MTGGALRYSHTQRGMPSIFVAAVGISILAAVLVPALTAPRIAWGTLLLPVGLIGVLSLIILAIFTRLHVWIDDRELRWAFGSGWPSFRMPLDQIESVAAVTNPWWYGYGVRIMPKGTLYNIAGRHAVEVVRRNGQRVRIGTDEPDALLAALQAATSNQETENS